MSPILELNPGGGTTLPGPVDTIVCQSGQVIIIDKTTEPATTTTLNSDDVYEAEGKAGLGISDIDGSRIWYEQTLNPTTFPRRTDNQMIIGMDNQAHQDPTASVDDTPQNAYDPRGLVPQRTEEELKPEENLPAGNAEDSDAAVPNPVVEEPRGDGAGNSQTGSYESRTKTELNELAAERDIKGHSSMSKSELISALRGE